MKKLLLLFLLPVFSLAQTQIGNDISGEVFGDYSGYSVSLSANGTVVAIGAVANNGNGTRTGQVRVYENNAGNWTQISNDIDGEVAMGFSGWSVSLSSDGTVVAIGAPLYNENGIDAGYVRVFENTSGTWTQVGDTINGEESDDWSGCSVSLSSDGSVVAIGALNSPGNSAYEGHVRVFENISGTWTQVGADINGEGSGDRSGTSVSLSSDGTVVAIGAPNNDENGISSGHVRVFENISGTWTQVGDAINGELHYDKSGSSVSLSADGTVVAIGSPFNNFNGTYDGHVRVFENISGTWAQVGNTMNGEAPGDQSGSRVSLSSDGTLVVIGAPYNYENGNKSGHARVYRNIAGVWTQVGLDIDGEASDDESGFSVSLSSDGTVVAIGAPYNDSNGMDSGHVRMYDLSGVLSSDSFVQTNFMVYPNPSSHFVTVQLNEGLQLEKVNVYSTLGQLLKTEYNTIISVNGLAKGSYFFEVITNKGKAAKTFVVE